MWWKIYFWIITVLSVLGLIGYAGMDVWNLASWLEVISSILMLIGLYAYAYKKVIFTSLVWKVFFWLIMISWVFNLVYVFTPLETMFQIPSFLQNSTIKSETQLVIAIIPMLPAAYAMYKLGEIPSKQRSKKKK